jgi:hypothetical protein
MLEMTDMSEPVFVAFRTRDGNSKEILYREGRPTPTAIRIWLRAEMRADQADQVAVRGISIPFIPSVHFETAVLTAMMRVVVIFGKRDQAYYEALRTFHRARVSIPGAPERVLRFDPFTQPIGRLPIVAKDGVWIATYYEGKEKCRCPGNLSLAAMTEALKQCFTIGYW